MASLVAMLAILVLLVLVYQGVQRSQAAPPLRYTQTTYTPDKAVYVPGETLHFTPTLILGYGGRITGLRTIINVDTHRTARLCDGTALKQKYPLDTNLDRGAYGDVMSGLSSVAILIEKMPPGHYKVATNINGYGTQSGEVGHDVYFSIQQPC